MADMVQEYLRFHTATVNNRSRIVDTPLHGFEWGVSDYGSVQLFIADMVQEYLRFYTATVNNRSRIVDAPLRNIQWYLEIGIPRIPNK